ncbi:MAG: beta-glucosidase [Balneolaceae bacterium]|nr:MAG: beta-glucosidase [Balneolaceae bacterium]
MPEPGSDLNTIKHNYTIKAHPYKDASLPVTERVGDLLSRMTLREKIGQMTQLDISLINTTGKQEDVVLDAAKARELILNHHIGSFLNGVAVPPAAWYRFMHELTRIAIEETPLGIPLIYGIDHIHGAGYLGGGTIFPQNLNTGATFNPEHAFNTGRITALESADLGHHWVFAPVLDLGVNPLWPRFWETYGEDPHMAGIMGAAYVEGLQNNEETAPFKQAATGKHFLGYSDPRSGWDRTPAYLSMQQIHEFHRPAFQKAIDAGLKTIMTNSGEINGVPVVASHDILTKLLREEMGFEGVVITDWDDIGKLVDFHYTARNYTEATCAAVMAGIDMSMTPHHLKFNTSLLELVEQGRIPEERIDESVRRILKLKFELGLFEHPLPRDDRFDRIGKPENRQKALDAARESIVLLKNENNVLPARKPSRVGVFGISANSRQNLCGGWSLTWQGGPESGFPDSMHTVHSALAEEFADAEVLLFGPGDISQSAGMTTGRALEGQRSQVNSEDAGPVLANPQAGDATQEDTSSFLATLNSLDLIVYAGGEESYCEFAGNITDLRLPQGQIDELRLLSQSSTPLVLVLVQGRPRIINDILDETDAVLFAGLPGHGGAQAIAEIISGRVNPGGRMPVSYPMSPNHYLPYNHKKSNLYNFDPAVANQIVQSNESSSLFPFGFGLSYTTYSYTGLRLSSATMTENGSITASVTVTNTGAMKGTETVLWFSSTHVGRITRPVKELRHFQKVTLRPGESETLSFAITPGMLSYPDENGRPVVEKGTYSLLAGDQKVDFRIADSSID